VEVTSAAGTTLTVTRGVDGTTAFSHNIAAEVVHGITARDVAEPNTHINANSGVHGATGAVVGATDTQTLTNKTISADNNNIVGFPASSFLVSNASGKADGSAAVKAIPSGTVVGTTDTQTLTNKTLTAPAATGSLASFGEAWTSYTPTWGGGGPSIGNGTLAGSWVAIGKVIHYRITLVAGSTTTFGSSSWTFTLPTAAHAGITANALIGAGSAYDVSGVAVKGLLATWVSGQLVAAIATDSGSFLSGSVPFAWANTDVLSLAGTYEAA
jgi:hypothetical protein